jgi:hypothetical protein
VSAGKRNGPSEGGQAEAVPDIGVRRGGGRTQLFQGFYWNDGSDRPTLIRTDDSAVIPDITAQKANASAASMWAMPQACLV